MSNNFISGIWNTLVEPPARLDDVALRYKSRFLNIFLLVFLLVFAGVDIVFLLTVPNYLPPWYGYLFLFSAYLLNKVGRYDIASSLTIAMFPIVIFASIVSGEAGYPLITLYYLIPGLIFGGILLSIRSTAVFTLAGIGIILSMPLAAPQTFSGISSVIGPLSTMLICGVLVLVSMWSRDQIEKERQSQLRESEERLRFALDAANMGTWSWDIRTGKVEWSDRIKAIFGLEKNKFDGRYDTYLSLIHPDDLPQVEDMIQRALAEKDFPYFVEHRVVQPNGSIRWLEGRGNVSRDQAGQPVRMAGTVVDITERKRAEEMLHRAQENYRNIVENSAHGIFQSTPQGRYLSVNPAMARIYGYDTPEELMSSILAIPQQIYVERTDRERFVDLLEKNGAVFGFEARNRKKDGSSIWASTNARLVRDAAGNILYYEGTVEDITRRKDAEAERERLLAELAAKNAELERFVYTVSHDLKSPLVTIMGFLGYLEKDFQSGDKIALQRDMDRIRRAVNKMQDLLTDLLDLSRIGRMMNEPQVVPFDALVREALELTDGRLRERGVQVTVQPGLPSVYGDSQRLLELIQNLIDNAAKYMGSQPQPRIEIGTSGFEADKPIFYIRDNGMGIAPEHHERIFGLFNKLDPHTEGTGVGLALVKRIVEFHGGRIWVQSEPEHGTTFFFTLPIGERERDDIPDSD
ncbi:MAG TPA: PAS domain S-box protein [Anaerolineales bacterium]|nr:PAS domain S-box protein [Anaerolineales bacterium]